MGIANIWGSFAGMEKSYPILYEQDGQLARRLSIFSIRIGGLALGYGASRCCVCDCLWRASPRWKACRLAKRLRSECSRLIPWIFTWFCTNRQSISHQPGSFESCLVATPRILPVLPGVPESNLLPLEKEAIPSQTQHRGLFFSEDKMYQNVLAHNVWASRSCRKVMRLVCSTAGVDCVAMNRSAPDLRRLSHC